MMIRFCEAGLHLKNAREAVAKDKSVHNNEYYIEIKGEAGSLLDQRSLMG